MNAKNLPVVAALGVSAVLYAGTAFADPSSSNGTTSGMQNSPTSGLSSTLNSGNNLGAGTGSSLAGQNIAGKPAGSGNVMYSNSPDARGQLAPFQGNGGSSVIPPSGSAMDNPGTGNIPRTTTGTLGQPGSVGSMTGTPPVIGGPSATGTGASGGAGAAH